jgi:hypothetical protein
MVKSIIIIIIIITAHRAGEVLIDRVLTGTVRTLRRCWRRQCSSAWARVRAAQAIVYL